MVLIVGVAQPLNDISLPTADMGIYIRQDMKVSITLPGQDAEYPSQQRLERACLNCGLFSKSWCNPETDLHFFTVQSFSGEIKDFYEQSSEK